VKPHLASTQHSATDAQLVADGKQIPKRKIAPNDIAFNVTPREAMIRFGVMLLLPIALLFVDKHLIIYSVPVVIYLFITGITRYCIVKYVWRRVIKHKGPIASAPYGKDISYPDEGAS
jgi:hypothetical protein